MSSDHNHAKQMVQKKTNIESVSKKEPCMVWYSSP